MFTNTDSLFAGPPKTFSWSSRRSTIAPSRVPTPQDRSRSTTSLLQPATGISVIRSRGNTDFSELQIETRAVKSYTKYKTPPLSWSRFPSHDREERNTRAGVVDGTDTRDFAIKSILPNGEIEWKAHAERKHIFQHHDEAGNLTHFAASHHRVSAPAKAVAITKAGFAQLLSNEEAFQGDIMHGRRGSTSAGGMVDYPELEMLAIPGDWEETNELDEMQESVEAELRRNERAKRNMILPDFAGL